MKKYLIKWRADENDADYQYGLAVVDEDFLNKMIAHDGIEISVGYYAERELGDCYSYEEITEEQYKVLKELGLDQFGERFIWQIEDSLNREDEPSCGFCGDEVYIEDVCECCGKHYCGDCGVEGDAICNDCLEEE